MRASFEWYDDEKEEEWREREREIMKKERK
jgi:hypothetical protein